MRRCTGDHCVVDAGRVLVHGGVFCARLLSDVGGVYVSASERLRELAKEAGGFEFIPVNPSDLGYVQRNEAEEILTDALPLIADVVEAAEREGSGVAVIRALGFIGNAHYCPDCMNHFHDDHGQHETGCSVLAQILADEEWPDLIPLRSLTALRDFLEEK